MNSIKNEIRKELSYRYLKGEGIEFGALNNPLVVSEKEKVLFVDKSERDILVKFFRELRPVSDTILTPDIILDIESKKLLTLKKYNCDFFIANHVLEHLVNPILFLERLHKIMKPGAVLYLAVPDKNHCFDRPRELTTWEHLYAEYQNNTRKLSIEHIEDFLFNVEYGNPDDLAKIKTYYQNFFKRSKMIKTHRLRSIHVHVWDQHSFANFIEQIINELNLDWKILEYVDSDRTSEEMIYILKKS